MTEEEVAKVAFAQIVKAIHGLKESDECYGDVQYPVYVQVGENIYEFHLRYSEYKLRKKHECSADEADKSNLL